MTYSIKSIGKFDSDIHRDHNEPGELISIMLNTVEFPLPATMSLIWRNIK